MDVLPELFISTDNVNSDDEYEYDGDDKEKLRRIQVRRHLAERNKQYVMKQETKELVKEMEIPDLPFENSPFHK